MAKKHKKFPVSQLCSKSVCEKRAQTGSGARLGNFGKKVTDRTSIFQGRRGAKRPEFALARAKIGKAAPSPTESVGYKVQAHHMICKKCYLKDDYFEFASNAGWDIDNGRNCILLPKYCGYMMWEELQFHKSGHWDTYYQFVEAKLTNIVSGYTKKDFCDLDKMKELHGKFHSLEDKLFGQLKQGMGLALYADTAIFYGGDYKDEVGTSFEKARAWNGTRKPYDWYLKNTKRMPRCPEPSVTP